MFRNQTILILMLASLLSVGCSRVFYPVSCEDLSRPVIRKVCTLDPEIRETSGLAEADGVLWTMNDSGGEAALYGVDGNGSIICKSVLLNSINADWEDLAEDDSLIYVADVGNNFASRDTLQILIVRKSDLYNRGGVPVNDVISFVFTEPAVTTETGWSSNDCEALVAWGDSLYLFTKDWVDYTTSVYSLPKTPGFYQISPQLRLPVGFLITGADIPVNDRIVTLIGYRNYHPELVSYRFNESPAKIDCSRPVWSYPLKTGRQVEGICYNREGVLFISAEGSLFKPALFRVGK